jgi:hypothetical protein
MNRLLPVKYTVQSLAVIAYIHWWVGNLRIAKSVVRDALDIDSQCMFAVILFRTIENHVLPAWMSE